MGWSGCSHFLTTAVEALGYHIFGGYSSPAAPDENIGVVQGLGYGKLFITCICSVPPQVLNCFFSGKIGEAFHDILKSKKTTIYQLAVRSEPPIPLYCIPYSGLTRTITTTYLNHNRLLPLLSVVRISRCRRKRPRRRPGGSSWRTSTCSAGNTKSRSGH